MTELLPECPEHRADFDRYTDSYFKGDPLANVHEHLRAVAQLNPAQGSLSKMQTICANEVTKAIEKIERLTPPPAIDLEQDLHALFAKVIADPEIPAHEIIMAFGRRAYLMGRSVEAAVMNANPPPDVRRLVIAAREVAFLEPTKTSIRELDEASEAFASRIPWDNDPADEAPDVGELAAAVEEHSLAGADTREIANGKAMDWRKLTKPQLEVLCWARRKGHVFPYRTNDGGGARRKMALRMVGAGLLALPFGLTITAAGRDRIKDYDEYGNKLRGK